VVLRSWQQHERRYVRWSHDGEVAEVESRHLGGTQPFCDRDY
jgi:hypothetical protein